MDLITWVSLQFHNYIDGATIVGLSGPEMKQPLLVILRVTFKHEVLENSCVSLKGAGFEATLCDWKRGQRVLYPRKLSYGLRNSVALWSVVRPGLGKSQRLGRQNRTEGRPVRKVRVTGCLRRITLYRLGLLPGTVNKLGVYLFFLYSKCSSGRQSRLGRRAQDFGGDQVPCVLVFHHP